MRAQRCLAALNPVHLGAGPFECFGCRLKPEDHDAEIAVSPSPGYRDIAPTYRRRLPLSRQPLAVTIPAAEAIHDLDELPERMLRRLLWFTPPTEAGCLAVLWEAGHA